MRNIIVLAAMLAGLWMGAAPAMAQAEDTATAAQPVEAGNRICPVSGEEVGSMGDGYKVEYNGVVYNLCCPGCEAEFLKDPEKYIQIVEEELGSVSPVD